ncbi:pyoverdine biosynthesis protein PvcB [Legionella beliardensis]|uniref:Pyoverdine biosynthesis protein PvcB n=1 Tax=Legionella beliardensis TaxID=91822 RepID=A0A378HY95_9GAMM|nr:TauD/TfdA family dioxygenase [Legionella beliardensis]STX27868.1 pyoverdine biosynthesis protein PvcB [Legionella beliardensis]
MINSATEFYFQPYLIESKKQTLFDINLSSLLAQTTQYKIVLLRGFPALTRDELLNYCASQAKLLHWDFGPVMEMRPSPDAKNYLFTHGDVPLHWDGAFHQEPRFLFFHCLQAPAENTGGETLFVNTEKVWQQATTEQQRQWLDYELSFSTEKLAHYGGQIKRKLIAKHPDTGQTLMRFAEPVGEDYLNPVTVNIVNKSDSESKAIIKEISRLMHDSHACYQHQWQTGDYLIADNFSLLHGRNAFSQITPRHLRRIQIL